eukprot:TRINITY_DN72250_c0_g1_i1.p1 TRINITY_DN72250_c0_g1~~TRINITY_DN72250_c0_g1_i1.p1  ORF type:complete len:305 (+),score=39.25 TRINITY_DN72250_c0_g1_i1:65-979(+)
MEGMEAKLDELASMIERLPLLTSSMESVEAKLEDLASMIEKERRTRTLENLELRSAIDELKCNMEDLKTCRVFTDTFTKSFREEIEGRLSSSEKSIREQLHSQLELLEQLLGEVKNRNGVSQVHDCARPRSPSPIVRKVSKAEFVASKSFERCFSEAQLGGPSDAKPFSKAFGSELSPMSPRPGPRLSVPLPIDGVEKAAAQRAHATQAWQVIQASPRRSPMHQVQRSQSGIIPRSPIIQMRQPQQTVPEEVSIAVAPHVQRFQSYQTERQSPLRSTVMTARGSPLATPRVVVEQSVHWQHMRP